MMKKTARENGVDPNELKFISDRGSAIIKCLSVCTHFNCTFHIANNLIKYVKRETGVTVSSEDGKVINTLLSEIAETADITEAVRKIWTIIDIFRKGLSSENSKKYKSMEEASLYVGSKIEVCTTATVPLINSGKWDVVLIPQFIEPPNPFMHSVGHFILNIIDVKERHVYVDNTLSRNRPKL